ncbi:hypothetical protein Tco_0667507 [Tanacetum coccineum]
MVTSEEKLENIMDISDLKLLIDHLNDTTTYIKKDGLTSAKKLWGLVAKKKAWSPIRPSPKRLKTQKLKSKEAVTLLPVTFMYGALTVSQTEKDLDTSLLSLMNIPEQFGPYFKHPLDLLPDDDSEAENHGTENRYPNVDGTKTDNSDNTSSISNSEATHNEDGTESRDNTSSGSDSGAT